MSKATWWYDFTDDGRYVVACFEVEGKYFSWNAEGKVLESHTADHSGYTEFDETHCKLVFKLLEYRFPNSQGFSYAFAMTMFKLINANPQIVFDPLWDRKII